LNAWPVIVERAALTAPAFTEKFCSPHGGSGDRIVRFFGTVLIDELSLETEWFQVFVVPGDLVRQ
jgi:hypothetical protein